MSKFSQYFYCSSGFLMYLSTILCWFSTTDRIGSRYLKSNARALYHGCSCRPLVYALLADSFPLPSFFSFWRFPLVVVSRDPNGSPEWGTDLTHVPRRLQVVIFCELKYSRMSCGEADSKGIVFYACKSKIHISNTRSKCAMLIGFLCCQR